MYRPSGGAGAGAGGGAGVGSGAALDGTIALSGRDFAGLQLDLPAQRGGIELGATRAFAWTEAGPAGPVQRMMLIGSVRVKLGPTALNAARAVVWIERLEDAAGANGGATGGLTGGAVGGAAVARHQVAVLFDRVSSPTASSGLGGGASGLGAASDRLLVSAVVEGELSLRVDAPPQAQRPEGEALLTEAEARFARYLTALERPETGAGVGPGAGDVAMTPEPRSKVAYEPGLTRPYEPGSALAPDAPRAVQVASRAGSGSDADPTRLLGDQRLFSGSGLITVSAGDPALIQQPGENVVVITGGVVLQYSEPARERALQLSAQRAVVFLDPGPLTDVARLGAQAVRGVYLEGDVIASDGRFSLRAPRMFYDVRNNRATMVDAVFWTYDQRRGLPLYVRAKAIEQTARNQIKARGVTMAASAFFEPQLSIGAREVTVTREARDADAGGGERVMVRGSSLTPRIAGVPLLWLPAYRGDLERFPIRDVRFENSSAAGPGLQTRWDLFGLTGIAAPDRVDLDLLVDGWLRRGVGVGLDSAWAGADQRGAFFGYFLPSDGGEDVLASGTRIDRKGDSRGLMLLEQRWDLSPSWRLLGEASYVSDEAFLQTYDAQLTQTRRELVSGLALRNTDQNALFQLQTTGTLTDFSPNQYLLQSQGYAVTRMPEFSYARVADNLFGDLPGVVQWSHEYRIGRLRLDGYKTTPRSIGYENDADAQRAFGLNADQSWADRLAAAGAPDAFITRLYTRQELAVNIYAGPVTITPFGTLALTSYSDELKDVSGAAAGPVGGPGVEAISDSSRWWAAGGLRASTSMQRVYPGARSELLGIDQLRHVVTPSVTLFHADSGRDSATLPIFDREVEGVSEGTAAAFAIDQVFQTKRGLTGDGRGHVADWLKLRTELVTSNNETVRSPIGRWYDTRPELSNLGDFATVDATMQLTDAVSVSGGTVYDTDTNQQARTSAGLWVDHGRDFAAFTELRYINPLDTTFLTVGGTYRLTPKYTVEAAGTIDTDSGKLRSIASRLDREFPDLTFSVKIGYDQLTDEFTTGVLVTPLGRNRRVQQFRRLGRDQYLEPLQPEVPGPASSVP